MDDPKKQYRGILKATSIIGGSAFINILLGMVRTKIVAILLGPTGVALIGIFTSLNTLLSTLCGLGIGTSGVREIAESNGAGDTVRLGETAAVVRQAVWWVGSFGMLLTILLSPQISEWSFGDRSHTWSIIGLSLTVLLTNITLGQSCLLQGMRRIKDIAKITVFGSLITTIAAAPVYYVWGTSGIVPVFILTALCTLAFSWYYSSQVSVERPRVPWSVIRTILFKLLHFGVPIMLAALMGNLGLYLIRILLIRMTSLEDVGLYLAAFAISGVLVQFVLTAMGTDYYPRLTAVSSDPDKMAEIVNAQTSVALLLALPIMAATIVFSPLIIPILYNSEFLAAIDILRWCVFGVFGRLVSWPLGYVLMALGKGKTYLLTEFLGTVSHIGLVWWLTGIYGLPGSGMAFAFSYLLYTILVAWRCYYLTRKTWSLDNVLHIVGFLAVFAGLVVFGRMPLPTLWHWIGGILITAALGVYCLYRICQKTDLLKRFVKQKPE